MRNEHDGHAEGGDSPELSPDLKSLDDALGPVLREHLISAADEDVLDRIVAASLAARTPEPLRYPRGAFARQFRAAAAVVLVAGLAIAAWFASQGTTGDQTPAPRSVAIRFEHELGVASAEEAILVAVLGGDDALVSQASFDRPGAFEVEPVVRTRGTNIDNLADEINMILGTPS